MAAEIVISSVILLVSAAPIIVIGGIFAMIAYHEKLDRMYYKKEGDK